MANLDIFLYDELPRGLLSGVVRSRLRGGFLVNLLYLFLLLPEVLQKLLVVLKRTRKRALLQNSSAGSNVNNEVRNGTQKGDIVSL